MTPVAVAPSTLSNQAVEVIEAKETTKSNDDDDEAQSLLSSLRKFIEKKKLVKSIEKTLTSVLNRIEKVVSPVDTPVDIQQRTKILCKFFDDEFTTLTNVASI